DEQRITHPPQMPRDALCAGNAVAPQQTNISDSGNEGDAAAYEVKRGPISALHPRGAACSLDAISQVSDHDQRHTEECNPVCQISFLFCPPGRQPGRCHQIESEYPAQTIC